MVSACSTQAAMLFGMYPRKGAVQVGSDADLVVYDPSWRGTFNLADSYSRAGYQAYEGWEKRGRAAIVTVRGAVQVRDGRFVGTKGTGQFIARAPTHG
jgi:dihydropyrimidinase